MLATHRAHWGRDKSASARAKARGLHDGQADGGGRGGGSEAAADGGKKSHFLSGKAPRQAVGRGEAFVLGDGGCQRRAAVAAMGAEEAAAAAEEEEKMNRECGTRA
jgi:hypothetical protein